MMLTAVRRSTASRRAAFTLLEVLVVVAILVILAGVGVVATTRYLEDARKSKAQLQCKTIATAIEGFYTNPNSGGNYPTSLQELVTPPWGGSSYLRDPQADLTDPWGQQFQMQMTSLDGTTQVPLIFTVSKDDQIPISQFGVGPGSRVGNQSARLPPDPGSLTPGLLLPHPSARGAAVRNPRPRSGFTLLELLVVLAVLIILAAAILPSTSALNGNVRQRVAADVVRARLADARARAMDAGVAYRLAVNTEGTKIRLAPDVPEFASLTPDSLADPDNPATKVSEDTLEKATAAVTPNADGEAVAPDAGGWVTVATYVPEGYCREDNVTLEIREDGFPAIRIQIRGVTGSTRVLPVQTNGGQP